MFYIVYKTTNMVNGKIYIGCHKTENVEDGYIGSGKILKRAIAKYGLENFSREIIVNFDNSDDMFDMEAQIVTTCFVNENTNYNLKIGGEGGFDYINANLTAEQKQKRAKAGHIASGGNERSLRGSQKHHQLLKTDLDYREWYLQQCQDNPSSGFLGKTHSDETKQKMSQSHIGKIDGDKNPNYGKCWVYSIEEQRSISIQKDELNTYINNGWSKGRKIKF